MKSILLFSLFSIFVNFTAGAQAPEPALDRLLPPTLHANRDELIRYFNPDQRESVWAVPSGDGVRWRVRNIPRMSFGSVYHGVLVKTRYGERGPRRWAGACEDGGSLFEPVRPFSEVIEIFGDAAFTELKQALSHPGYELQKRCDRRLGLGGLSRSHFIREIILQDRTGRTLHCVQRMGAAVPDRALHKKVIAERRDKVTSVEYLCLLGEVLNGF